MRRIKEYFRVRFFPRPTDYAVLEEAGREYDELVGIFEEVFLVTEALRQSLQKASMFEIGINVDTTMVWLTEIRQDLRFIPRNSLGNACRNLSRIREIHGPLMAICSDVSFLLLQVDEKLIETIGLQNCIDVKTSVMTRLAMSNPDLSERSQRRIAEYMIHGHHHDTGMAPEYRLMEINVISMDVLSEVILSDFYRKRIKRLPIRIARSYKAAIRLVRQYGGQKTLAYLESSLQEFNRAGAENDMTEAFERYQYARAWLAQAFREMENQSGS